MSLDTNQISAAINDIANATKELQTAVDRLRSVQADYTNSTPPTLEECKQEVLSRVWKNGLAGTTSNTVELVYHFIRDRMKGT